MLLELLGYAETVPHAATARDMAPDAAPGRQLRQELEAGSASTRSKPMDGARFARKAAGRTRHRAHLAVIAFS